MADIPELTHDREIVLIALTGLSPATLTETLWALAMQDEPQIPDRIIVITTTTGKKHLQESLFADTPAWDTFKLRLATHTGLHLEDKLRFGPIPECIRVIPAHSLSTELDDIRTPEDNRAVADFLMETLRGLTENNSLTLITSIAGGRKTMGALLLSVMCLLGRIQDRVTHVLVNEPWDKVPGFLYPHCPGTFHTSGSKTRLDTATATVSLADVPFIPLRYLFEKELKRSAGSYLRLVDELRAKTLNLVRSIDLTLQPRTAGLSINSVPIALSPMEYLYYWYFSHRCKSQMGPIYSYKELPTEDLANLLSTVIRTAPNGSEHWSSTAKSALTSYDPDETGRRLANSIKQKLKKADIDPYLQDILVPSRGRLALAVPPESITIEL